MEKVQRIQGRLGNLPSGCGDLVIDLFVVPVEIRANVLVVDGASALTTRKE